MKGLAVLLVGINVSAFFFMVAFAPALDNCTWPTGDWIAQFMNCHRTDYLFPCAVGLAVLSASYFYFRSAERARRA